jgi:DNA-directed RNA polymerase specialized sigma24 family protein
LRSDTEEYLTAVKSVDGHKMRAWLWRYCRRYAVLKDLQQDAYEDLVRCHGKSLSIPDFDAHVRRICMRRGAAWVQQVRQLTALQAKVDVQAPPGEDALEREVGLAWVLKRALRLPRVQRSVFLKHAVWGYTPREIARTGRRAETTVRRTLHDARQSLSELSLDDEKP